jgi:hypothetical protein
VFSNRSQMWPGRLCRNHLWGQKGGMKGKTEGYRLFKIFPFFWSLFSNMLQSQM